MHRYPTFYVTITTCVLRHVIAGSQIGNVVTFPLAGLLCAYGFDGGWPSVFYVLGAFGVLWFVAWMFIASDTPEQHPRISERERNYIQKSLKGSLKKTTDADVSGQGNNSLHRVLS